MPRLAVFAFKRVYDVSSASMKMKRSTLILASLLVLAACGYVNLLASQRAAILPHPVAPTAAVIAADPLPRVGMLHNVPTFLLFDDQDHRVPPVTNEEAAQALLGPRCRCVVFHGGDHDDPRIFNPELVAGLLAGIPKDVPAVLLHGTGGTGAEWFVPKGATGAAAAAALTNPHTFFGEGLRRHRPCKAGDFGGCSWGDADAIHILEALTAHDRRVVLVGCSMGGALMFRFAEKHPDKVVAMVGLSAVCSLKAMCGTDCGSDIVRTYAPPAEGG